MTSLTSRALTLRMPQQRVRVGLGGARLSRPVAGGRAGVLLRGRAIVAGALAVVGILAGLWASYEVRVVGEDLDRLRREAALLQAQNERLRAENTDEKVTERVERLAKGLGLRPPAQDQVVRLK